VDSEEIEDDIPLVDKKGKSKEPPKNQKKGSQSLEKTRSSKRKAIPNGKGEGSKAKKVKGQ